MTKEVRGFGVVYSCKVASAHSLSGLLRESKPECMQWCRRRGGRGDNCLPQTVPKAVSEHKNFLGGMPPDPPRGAGNN